MIARPDQIGALRASPVADLIRRHRLIAILRRVEPHARLMELVGELAEAGVRVFEVTLDGVDAAAGLSACRRALPDVGPERCLVGAGTVRTVDQVRAALDAGGDFAVAPVLDPEVVERALGDRLPFVPGAFGPTEADRAWRLGATFVKLFPGSSLGPTFVRELRGPLPEIETIVTGGVDAGTAAAFLAAGAVAVGVGSAITRATATERRAILAAVAGS